MKRWFALGGLALLLMLTPASALAKSKSADKLVQGPTYRVPRRSISPPGRRRAGERAWLSHIGRRQIQARWQLRLPQVRRASPSAARAAVVAANGDRLFVTFTGTLEEIVVHAHEQP